MEEGNWRNGCLFCRTGMVPNTSNTINQTVKGIEAIAPTRTRRKTVARKVINRRTSRL